MILAIDTIHIDIPMQATAKLADDSSYIDNNTGEIKYTQGYMACVKVKKFAGRIRLECSLPKLMHGNNIKSLSLLEVKTALDYIGKLLEVDIWEGVVRRLDLEFTIETKYEIPEYFKFLGSSKYYKRSEIQKTSLYYQNKSRVINIYDKIHAVKASREKVPNEYLDKNLMRFECRYKKKLLSKFASDVGIQKLMVKDIIRPDIFTYLMKHILGEYQAIHKINEPISNFDVTSKIIFNEQMMRFAIDYMGGLNRVLEKIDSIKVLNPEIPKEHFSRRKKEMRVLCNISVETMPPIIDELNHKIYNEYLSKINFDHGKNK